jgi:hypothetical protein
MIWLTWRQHRMQLLFAVGGLSLVSIILLFSGREIAATFQASGLGRCLAVAGRDCGELANPFLERYNGLQVLIPLFMTLPALIGVFWGAPLVAREVEQGTHRLAWTQGVTRMKWLGVKLGTLTLAAMALAGAFTLVLVWWSRPLVTASDNRFGPGPFDLRGIVPVGYVFFVLALAVAAGAVIRRTLPAMATTITAFAAVRAGVTIWLRGHFMPAKTLTYPALGYIPRIGRGDWILSTKTFDAAGRFMGNGNVLNLNLLGPRCPSIPPPEAGLPNKEAVLACVRRVGLHVVERYQPGARYWLFQGIETGIFVAMGLGLIGLAAWWVNHRVS